MMIWGPFDEIPPRRLKHIFTPDQENRPVWQFKSTVWVFKKSPITLIHPNFTPGPNDSNKKLLNEPLKMSILRPFVKIPPRRLKLIFTPGSAKRASLRLEIFSLGLFGNPPSRGFVLIFTPGPKESNMKVTQEPLEMTTLGPYVEIPLRRLKLTYTPDPPKLASLGLQIYKIRWASTTGPLKMTTLGPCVEIPA